MTTSTRLALVVGAALLGATTAGPSPARAAGSPAGKEVTDWIFYKVKWGHQEEFMDIFQKYQYRVLKAQVGSGLVGFKVYTPTYHGDGRADWSVAVALTYRDAAARINPPAGEIARKLFPDQAAYQTAELRRWEILEAHWDMPLSEVDFETRGGR